MKLRLQAAAALVALIALFSAADAHANLRKQQEGPSSSVGPSASISVDSLVNQLSQSSVRDAIKQAQDSVTQKDVEGISPRPFKAASLRGAPKAAATKRKSKVKPTAVVSSNSNTINIPKKRAADKSDAVKVREYEQDVKRQTEQTAKAAEEEDQKRQEFLAEEEADKQNPKAKMMKTQEGKVKLSLKASAMAREANFKTEAGIKKQHMQLEAELREKKSLEKIKQAVAKVAQDEQEKKKEMRKNMKSYFESLNLKSQQKAMAQLDRMDRQSKKDAEKLEKQLKATGELQAEEDRKFNAKKDEHARKQSLEWEKSDEEYVKAVKRGQDQLAALKAKEDELEAKKQQQQEKLDKAAAEKMAIWEAKNKADMVKEEAEKKEEDHMATVVSKVYTPKYDNIIAQDKDLMTANWKKAYTMTFWLKPTGTTGQFTNIFHKGHDDKQRNPSIWIMPNSARIHIRSGTSTGSETSSSSRSSQSWVNGTNVGCDPADSLLGATWNFVGIVHMNTSMEVFFVDPEAENIKRVCYRKLDAPVKNTGPLYSSAPAGLPFIGEIADVRMYNRDLSKYEVFRIAKQKKYKQET